MVSNIFLLLLEYRKIDLKKPCFHLSMRKSWINDKITTFPELIRELRTWGNWTIWNSWRGSLLHGERDAWVGPSMADQGRRRCQPPYLCPHRRKGMPVSRNKYYLPQPPLVPIRCLTFNKKLIVMLKGKKEQIWRDKASIRNRYEWDVGLSNINLK